MASKRKPKVLSLVEKMEILNKLESGENICKLSKEYGVGRATISDVRRKKQRILDRLMTMESGPGKRKTLRVGNYPEMEKALYTWFVQQRSDHIRVTGDILKAKAIEFYRQITKKNDFRASVGWLVKFKQRFGINRTTKSHKKITTEETTMQSFIQHFKKKVGEMDLIPDQIYNVDESALFWRLFPNKTSIPYKEVGAPDRKEDKDRVTLMPCANATGTHKLDLIVIGKAKNSKAFKNICLPVRYKYQSNNSVTKDIFSEWFYNDFVPEVKDFMKKSNLPDKALLVYNGANHPDLELTSRDGNIQTLFLPSNCAPLQPKDQNIIQKIKSLSKNMLLIQIMSQNGDISQMFNDLNLRDVVLSLGHAWSAVSPVLIQSSWKKLLPSINSLQEIGKWDPDDNVCIADWVEYLAERGFETCEEDLNSWFEEPVQIMTDETKCKRNESVKPIKATVTIEPEKAYNCVNTVITWGEENDLSAEEMLLLKNIRKKILKQRRLVKTDLK